MNTKKIILILIISLSICLVFFCYGCAPDTVISENISLSIPDDSEVIELTIGDEFLWNQFYFDVLDENGTYLESVPLDNSLISNDDLLKLDTPGQKSLKVSYKGKTLFITVLVHPRVIVNSYDVIFDAAPGSFEATGSLPSAEVRTEQLSVIIELPIPTRSGYSFIGWYLNQDYSGNKIVSPYNVLQDITLYAKWEHSERHSIEYREIIDDEDKGIIGTVVTNIIHADTRSLMIPTSRPKYNFLRYDIFTEVGGELIFSESIDSIGEIISVNSDLIIRVIFETRMLTINYYSDEWVEGSKSVLVEYGSSSDIHFYVLPEKIGNNGSWVNRATLQSPIYYNIVENMQIDAVYSVKSYTLHFFDDDSIELVDLIRTEIPHGTKLSNPPSVPLKDGYSGSWAIISDLPETSGQFLEIEIADFVVDSNINIYAIYTKNTYMITYRFSMISKLTQVLEDIITQKYHLYQSLINIDDSENLYSNRVIDDLEYNGYDILYYEVKWYTSASFESSKLVTFPFSMKSSDLVLFARIVERPYIIQFIIPQEFGTYEDTLLTQYKNNYITPPEYEIPGYDILGWYSNIIYVQYNELTVYMLNDYVKFEDFYYKCLQDTVQGISPNDNPEFWEEQGETRPKEMRYLDEYPQLLADDFYLFNTDERLDRAFYPLVTPKTYFLRFFTWEISGSPGSYSIDKSVMARDDVINIQHGANIRLSTFFETIPSEPYPTFPPEYPTGGPESDFVLQNWYTDIEYTSEAISPDQDIIIESNLFLYSYWTDLLAGTEGLIFSVYEGNQQAPESYQVTGFLPQNKEYSTLDVVLPENHQGLPVKSINSGVFSDNLSGIKIESIFIPSNIEHIGENAFSGCKYLESIILDDNNINFVLENGVLFTSDFSSLICMPPYLSINDNYVSTYEIPSVTTNIFGGAFSNCVNLLSIAFSDVEISGIEAFEGSSIYSIGEFAFSGCLNLESIVIPNSLSLIGDNAFIACYSLEHIYIGDNALLKFVGSDILIDSKWFLLAQQDEYICLGNVLIGYNPSVEEQYVFVPDNIVSLADNAFNFSVFDCSNLQTITFSSNSNLLYVGKNAFAGCSQLSNLFILSPDKVSFENDSLLQIPTECLLHVPSSLFNLYNLDPHINTIFSYVLNNLVEQ